MISSERSEVTAASLEKLSSSSPPARAKLFEWGPLQLTCGFSCLILLLLQLWRPYFFLADDSLVYWFPIVVTMGDQIAHGQSVATNPYLFGGYHLLSDPLGISLWNPLVLLLALVANTRFYLAIVDIYCSVNLLISSLAFTLLLCRLRELNSLDLPNRRIVFLSLSFTFSSYALTIGACWLMFLANSTVLSLLAMGLLCEKRSSGVRYVAAGLVFGIYVGHLSPFLFSVLFFSVFALCLSWANRSREPLQVWVRGGLWALLLCLPPLIPATMGFMASARSGSLGTVDITKNAVPLTALVLAFLGSYIGIFTGSGLGIFSFRLLYGLAGCAASGLFWGSLPWKKKLSRVDIALIVTTLVVVLFIVRPHWLGAVLSHTPLFRSLRWPFREVFVLLFFLHLWIALRPVTMNPRKYAICGGLGAALFAASLCIVTPWTFSPYTIDRELLRNGKAAAYWESLRSEFKPGDQLISIVGRHFADENATEIPFTLLGAFNYPALFKIASISGYTAPGLQQTESQGDVPYHMGGMYSEKVGRRMLARNPHLKAMRLVSLYPPRIELCTGAGCRAVEVPAYTPPEVRGKVMENR
jgi:hypothetical protein